MSNHRRFRQPAVLGFVGPAVLYLVVISIVPLVHSLWLAFHNWSLMTKDNPPYIGWDNFARLLSDERLWRSLALTGVYGAITLLLEIVVGLGVALLLSRRDIRGIRFIRSVMLLPIVVAPLAAGYTFRLMLHPNVGPVNYIIAWLGLPRVNWLGNPAAAFVALILVTFWQWLPFASLVITSALQSLPLELIEAAQIDGASRAQVFRHVIFPMLIPTLLVVVLIRGMEILKAFDLPFVLTGGGPGTATEFVSLYTYKVGFGAFDLGYAAAISYVLLVIVVVVSQTLLRLVLRQGVWEGI